MRTRLYLLTAHLFLLGVLLSEVDSKGTFYGGQINPFYGHRYNLYKAGVNPQHAPNKPMTRHKNHCAYMVQKNVTCIMQDGVATFVKAEYTTKCIWGQKCPVVVYRTFFKPLYKVGFKTVTELEWRCCPGYSGEACGDRHTSLPEVTGRGQPDPGKPFPGVPTGQVPSISGRPTHGVTGERLNHMDRDLQRFNHSLRTLNGVVASLADRLSTLNGFGDLKSIVTEVQGRPVLTPGLTSHLEEILDDKLATLRTEIYNHFEDRLDRLEKHYNEKIQEVQKQCLVECLNGWEQIQQRLDGTETIGKKESGPLPHQIQGLTLTESCCGQVNNLSEQMLWLQRSVQDLTGSQSHLKTTLTEQRIHTETIVQNPLVDIKGKPFSSSIRPGGVNGFSDKSHINGSTSSLLDGHVIPALETAIESLRTKVEGDLSGIQKHLVDLEHLCTSSCARCPPPAGGVSGTVVEEECPGMEKKMTDRLDFHSNWLDRLNTTLNNLLIRTEQESTEGTVQGEITLLKVNINSVNRTLKGLRDSLTFIATEVGHANSSWEQREHQLVNQLQGLTKLMGHQASLLGAGERRLAQLKEELATLKRQLTGGLQGCRSAAMEVQEDVKHVDTRVTQVEGQCSNLRDMVEHLERIRAELERHSDTYLAQVNGTLTTHSEQLAELKRRSKTAQPTKHKTSGV
ncbi:EMILIN-3 [Oryzias melastigma]|uniref:EMILIN-3 n=1 Tax=Oryzias melastigma TaxID=30732 RepID=A0A3B3DFM6_ORYME|nr:EMILIN-3 [Oryzias melastigma]KAF6730438.1 EMILIN-3 [Oryzias melastigma]